VVIHKYLQILALACLIVTVVVFSGISWRRHELRAGGLPSEASSDSMKLDKSSDSLQATQRIPPRPEEYVSVTVNGVEYVEGTVVLKTGAHITILREYGFKVRTMQRLASKIVCKALWPKDLDLASLPEQVLQVRYAKVPKKEKPRRRIDPPPADFPFTTINGIDYAEGYVLLESDKDTTLLQRFGFRDFWSRHMDSVGVSYMARWPKELPWDSLPPQLKGVLYDDSYKRIKPQLNVSAVAIVADSASPVVPKKEKPRRRIEPPPGNYPIETIQGIDYVTGVLLLDSEKDTVLLQRFGFRDFWLPHKDSTGVSYMARWPKELPWDSLPPQLKGVVYPFQRGLEPE
jgi:hypothetical protein